MVRGSITRPSSPKRPLKATPAASITRDSKPLCGFTRARAKPEWKPYWGCFWRYSSNGWTHCTILPSRLYYPSVCYHSRYPFQPSPARIASKRPTLSSLVTSDLSRQMTRDEYVAQAHGGAAADLLSLSHEQTAETTGVGLTDNLMDAEPIQGV